MNWTKEQLQAIKSNNKRIMVSAAAGSGKTAVLTERITRLIIEGASIDNFLVVTFTEAATAEMKRRIAARLYTAAEGEKDIKKAARLRKEALFAPRANISTLHAFCLYIMRRNFHFLELDPAFYPADEVLKFMLFEEAQQETAAQYYEDGDKAFISLLKALGSDEKKFFAHIKRLYSFLMSQPEGVGWLEQAVEFYRMNAGEFSNCDTAASVLSAVRKRLNEIIENHKAVRMVMPRELIKQIELVDDDIMKLNALYAQSGFGGFYNYLHELKLGRLSWPRNGVYQKEYLLLKESREAIRKYLKTLTELFFNDAIKEANIMSDMLKHIEVLYDYMQRLEAEFNAQKQSRSVVDFEDMEHYALRALCDDGIATALKERFKYIFVDEYQDSSRIQEAIIERIAGEDNSLFLVGDVKQSIYRFRQADPSIFLERQRRYESANGNEATGEVIYLNKNFRSSASVINAVNSVFENIMKEPAYDEKAKLYGAGADSLAIDGAELHLIEYSQPEIEGESGIGDDGGESEETIGGANGEMHRAEVEAAFTANKILELMRTERLVDEHTGAERKLKYKDFVILLRTFRSEAKLWVETLSNYGVPAYAEISGGYFEAIEVQVFLNLLRVVDNMRQDIPLTSVLRSPIFGFTIEELVELKLNYPADHIYESFLNANDDSPLSKKVMKVKSAIEDWRYECFLQPLSVFISKLLDETGYYDYIGALPNGAERQANLNALLKRANEYIAAGGINNLSGFLDYMDGAKSSARLGCAQAGAADVVRVLSMHRSKGLEYPVVFIGGLSKKFNRRELSENLLYHGKLNLGAKLVKDKIRYDTFIRKAVALKLSDDMRDEEMCVLYVGMTRAKKRLIMLSCFKGVLDKLEQYKYADLSDITYGANSFIDWVLPVAQRTNALKIHTHNAASVALPEVKQISEHRADGDEAANILAQLKERFNWRYPYEADTVIPTKRSVSDLAQSDIIILEAIPSFMRMDEKPAERGTLMHAVLEELNLREGIKGSVNDYVEAELLRIQQKRRISSNQLSLVDKGALIWFLGSDLGERLFSSSRVERELSLSIPLPAMEMLNTSSTEPVMLQGVLDCCFIENGKWVLLDFKTDRQQFGVTADEAAKSHERQLTLYARALSTLTNIPVAQKIAVLLSYREYRVIE